MKFPERFKFVVIIIILVVGSIAGGILGNWLFIYYIDKYYELPGGQTNLPAVIRSPEKVISSDAAITQAIAAADSNLVGIFKRGAVYLPQNKLGQALILTNDGWLMSSLTLPTTPASWQNYTVVASDRKVYEIDRVVVATDTITFIHLKKVNNLPVQDLVSSHEIVPGQSVLAVEWRGMIEKGLVVNPEITIRSSETPVVNLPVSGLAAPESFLFDTTGRVVGFVHENKSFAIDTVENMFNTFLLKGDLRQPRLGVYYLNAGTLPVESGQGAVLTAADKQPAVIPGSPADKAQLQAGDIIMAVNDITLDSRSDLAVILSEYRSGDTITLTISRNKETKRVMVKLDEPAQ